MARTMTAVIGGVLLGIIAMLVIARFESSDSELVRNIVDVPRMAPAVAEKHRNEFYTSLNNIEEVLALPTGFTRAEALHVLAGRSDSANIQSLIFESNRVADEIERVDLLSILFFRLAEIDPESALVLARIDQFNSTKLIEQVIWRAWARKDLVDALFAAKTQTSMPQRNAAAQSLYAAYGYLGSKTTKRIEAELGIGPDRSTRSRYLNQLADRSPAEAIEFINNVENGAERQEYVSWLASYISTQDPTLALGYADLFLITADGATYSNVAKSSMARENPKATIERLMGSGRSARTNNEYYSAVRALAADDFDAVKDYFGQARSNEDRQMFGSMIVQELAKSDPLEALKWARANDSARMPYLQMSVLSQIAMTNPELAFTEALSISNAEMRSNMVGNVVQQIARTDPTTAVAYLDQIQDRQLQDQARQQLAGMWIHQDPDAAMDWILSQDEKTSGPLIQMAAISLVSRDLDAAIQILSRLGEQNGMSMRLQIAQRLAVERSAGEAQAFIQQYDGKPGYEQLQASVISGVAQTDALMAKQLADQLTDSKARDTAYVQVIAQRAQTDPMEAARWLRSVGDEGLRTAATGQLASQWYAHDPAAAAQWVSNLPSGSPRDDAIMQMSFQWRGTDSEKEKLIASIEDRDKRGQAKIRQVYNLMRTDPAKARELLEDEDIPSNQRLQIETMITQYGLRF